MRRLIFGLAAAGLSVALGLATGELAVRWWNPTPRVQVVRGGEVPAPDRTPLSLVGGEPAWSLPGSEARKDPGCGPDARRVLLVGSSIFWGTGYGPAEVVSGQLQQELDPSRSRWCVINHAQPGYTGNQKVATARAVLPGLRPDLVIWEVWANDVGDYALLGPDAYEVGKLVHDEEGFPVWLPLPSGLHHALFLHSALYRYATLALAPEDRQAYDRTWHWLVDEGLPSVLEATRAGGGRLVLVFAPFLDRPFAQSAAEHRDKLRGYVWTRAWAEAQQVPVLDLAEAWIAEDPEDLRHDPCCHYAPAGHALLARTLRPWVDALDLPPAEPP